MRYRLWVHYSPRVNQVMLDIPITRTDVSTVRRPTCIETNAVCIHCNVFNQSLRNLGINKRSNGVNSNNMTFVKFNCKFYAVRKEHNKYARCDIRMA